MKRYFHLILSCSALLLIGLAACKKQVSQIFLEGGNAPVLTASADSIALSSKTANDAAITFSWTNPDYKLTTGPSSHNVNYIIEIDTAGANFTNPLMQQITVTNDLTHSITVADLNNSLASLTKLALATDVKHNIEIRVVATLDNRAAPLPSNVLKFTIVPYETFAVDPPTSGELYITGDGTPSSWTNNPPASQHLTKVSKGDFYIIMDFVPAKQYKFLSDLNQWQPQYGGTSATGGTIDVNLGTGTDPAGIPTPDVAGKYKVEVNFKTGKYIVTKQ